MTRHRTLHPGYERLIGTAAVDRRLKGALLQDPRGTALQFGLTREDAEIAADIRAADLGAFAAALIPRLYGTDYTPTRYPCAAAG